MYTLSEKVYWCAVISRVCVLVISFSSNWLIADHEPGVFVSPKDPKEKPAGILDDIVYHLFGGLLRWDAQYFLHIAKYGYTYENCLAFFPLFPLLTRFVSLCLYKLLSKVLCYTSVVILCGVAINFICFVKSTVTLYKLGVVVLRDEGLAYRAAILFCFNPASIFFSALYSETVFAFCTFFGMLECAKLRNQETFLISSGMSFGLSALARSNGLLNLGFVAHQRVSYFFSYTCPYLIKKYPIAATSPMFLAPVLIVPCASWLISVCVTTLLCIVPFLMFQAYSYKKFCVSTLSELPYFLLVDAKKNSYRVPGFKLGNSGYWCNYTTPLPYSHIQEFYWDVGFLKYYQWKQIPNFLLALPVVTCILYFTYQFFKRNRKFMKSFGLVIEENEKKHERKENSSCNEDIDCDENESIPYKKSVFWSPVMFPYVYHAAFLTLFSVLFINVQVTTRLVCSACPIFYWYLANLFPDIGNQNNSHKPKLPAFSHRLKLIRAKQSAAKQEKHNAERIESEKNIHSCWRTFFFSYWTTDISVKLVRIYFLAYFIIGNILFSNNYPWT